MNTRTSTYHNDGIGSTRELTDTAGNITDTYTYRAFGGLEARTGITANNYLFTGEQFDPNLGFYYLRARYFDPEQGRLLSMDDFAGNIFEPATLHKYLYAHADPVNNLDPSGNITLGGTLSAIGTVARLALISYTGYSLAAAIYDERHMLHEMVVNMIIAYNGGAAGLAASAFGDETVPSAGAAAAIVAGAVATQGHHTIPEYLCGAKRQQLSRIPIPEHAQIHVQLYGIRVSALLGQELTIKKILRRPTTKDRNNDRFLLGGTSAGRATIAYAIEYVYEIGDWFGTGVPTISLVFPGEKRDFINGKSSYPNCSKKKKK